jgi:hypothetical protein
MYGFGDAVFTAHTLSRLIFEIFKGLLFRWYLSKHAQTIGKLSN